MSQLKAVVLYQDGKFRTCSKPQTLDCGSAVPASLTPTGNCCLDDSEYVLSIGTEVSSNPNTIYGAAMLIEGHYVVLDVMGGAETASTPMTAAILQAKADLLTNKCACTDCDSADPIPTIPAVYSGVFPSVDTGKCFEIVVAEEPTTGCVATVESAYLGMITSAVVTAVTATTFTVKVKTKGELISAANALHTVTAIPC